MSRISPRVAPYASQDTRAALNESNARRRFLDVPRLLRDAPRRSSPA